jgi:syntaxin-binding protein 1
LKENGKTAKMQKGVTQNLTINDMKKMIKDLPQYTELLTRYSLHMHLIGQCLETFNVAGLKQIGDIEQTVATGVDSNCDQPSSSDIFASAIKVMGSPSVSPQNKLRLAMLIVSSMYLNDANLQKVKSLLSSQNDVRALDNLIYLGIRNDSSKGATKSRLTDDEKKYFKNYAKNAKYDLIRFTPRLQVILEQLQNNQLSTSQFSTQTISTGKAAASGKKLLSNDLLAFKNMGAPKSNSLASKDKLIVFFVGGMSHSEVRVVKELGRLV